MRAARGWKGRRGGTPHDRRRTRILTGVTAVASLAIVGALTGCTATQPSADELEEAARAVAEEYVAAIVDQDLEGADGMTEAAALEVPALDDNVDVRAALPEATEPISEPWITLLGQEDIASGTQVRFQVSYLVGEVAGADRIELTHTDGDPADAWTVTDGLLVFGVVFARAETVPTFTFGGVELQSTQSSNVHVWGYPGTYLTEASDPSQNVEPVTVQFGVETTPPWNDFLPILEGVSEDE